MTQSRSVCGDSSCDGGANERFSARGFRNRRQKDRRLGSNQPFEFDQATVPETQPGPGMSTPIEHSIFARPFVAVGTAFLLGILLSEAVNERFATDREKE